MNRACALSFCVSLFLILPFASANTYTCMAESGEQAKLTDSHSGLVALDILRGSQLGWEHYGLQRLHPEAPITRYSLLTADGERVAIAGGPSARINYFEAAGRRFFYLYHLGQLSTGRFSCR